MIRRQADVSVSPSTVCLCLIVRVPFVEAGPSRLREGCGEAGRSASRRARPSGPPGGAGRMAQSAGRLFPPQDLGAARIARSRRVAEARSDHGRARRSPTAPRSADIGAGAGWFTIRLARRVGPNGIVYAQDVQRQMLEAIRRRVGARGAAERPDAARRRQHAEPAGCDRSTRCSSSTCTPRSEGDRVTFLRNLATALKPRRPHRHRELQAGTRAGPGPDIRIDSAAVEADARAAGSASSRARIFPISTCSCSDGRSL